MPTISQKVQVATPRMQFRDQNGRPMAGWLLFTYIPGTTTKCPTWTDSSGLTMNTNPIVLDAFGECDVWVPSLNSVELSPFPPGPPGPPGQPGVAGPPGATGNSAEFSRTIDIPSETIYTGFFEQYLPLADPDDANTLLLPVGMALGYKYQTRPYATFGANFVVSWGPPIFPTPVPNFTAPAAILELTADTTLILPVSTGLNGLALDMFLSCGLPLTLTLDAAPDAPPLINATVTEGDGGIGYAVNNTGNITGGLLPGGGLLATYKVLTIGAGGVVQSVELVTGGKNYQDTIGATTANAGASPGTGSGLVLDIESALTRSGTLRVTTWYRKYLRPS